MSERGIVGFIEDWQTGFFVVLGSAVVGVLFGIGIRSVIGPPGFLIGFVAGMVLGFLSYSYVRYGR